MWKRGKRCKDLVVSELVKGISSERLCESRKTVTNSVDRVHFCARVHRKSKRFANDVHKRFTEAITHICDSKFMQKKHQVTIRMTSEDPPMDRRQGKKVRSDLAMAR